MTHFTHGKINLYNMDCMTLMRETPDKFYDLAIVDPPFGAGSKFNFRAGSRIYENKRPSSNYFEQLFRTSKNQIIWGGNYFTNDLPESRGWIFWYKHNPINRFSDGELAWSSFDIIMRCFDYPYTNVMEGIGSRIEKTITPTQKPVALYKWLLQNYAKAGDKILDTHGGSMSIAIACYQMGFDLTLSELDKDYYNAGVKRFKLETAQRDLFIDTH